MGREWTVANLAEAVFYLMAVDQRSDGDATKVVEILEEWMSWTRNANLRRVILLSWNKTVIKANGLSIADSKVEAETKILSDSSLYGD